MANGGKLTYGDMSAVEDGLRSADLSPRQAESFTRLYELAAKQNPQCSAFGDFQEALAAYARTPSDPKAKHDLFQAAAKLSSSEEQRLSTNSDANVADKSALANACFGVVDALVALAPKDDFKPENDAQAKWPQDALAHFQQMAAIAKLEKRNILARACSMEDAIAAAQANPNTKIIGSKVVDGKLVYCELVLDKDGKSLIAKQSSDGTADPYTHSKKFASSFQATEGKTPVASVPSQHSASAAGDLAASQPPTSPTDTPGTNNPSDTGAAAPEDSDAPEDTGSLPPANTGGTAGAGDPIGDAIQPAVGTQAAEPIAAAAIVVADAAIVEAMECAILGDFNIHNGEIDSFDFATIGKREYETVSKPQMNIHGNLENLVAEVAEEDRACARAYYARSVQRGKAARPEALFAFIEEKHSACAEIADHYALDTAPEASVYAAHKDTLAQEFGDGFLADSLGHRIPGHFQADCSRIVAGNRTTCVSASPDQAGNTDVFLRALALELGDNDSGLIVGIACCKYFDRVAGVADVKEIRIDDKCSINIRAAKVQGKDGQDKTIYQMQIPGWGIIRPRRLKECCR